MTGASEFFDLARDFERAPAKVASALFDAYKGAGEGFRDGWQHNARATSGEHAAKYPDSISTEMRFAGFGIEVETGPEQGARNQGFLGRVLELGGEHSPPHLDGLRAMPLAEKRLDRLADAAIGLALP